MTTKVAETRGCQRCCVGRNPYNGYKYLCGILPTGIFLMQWYEPLNKFMLLKVCEFCIISLCHVLLLITVGQCAHSCPVAFWSLLSVEHLQCPHHHWIIRCLNGMASHSIEHLFNCWTHPTQLTVQDNMATVTDFHNLDSGHVMLEELLFCHNNGNDMRLLRMFSVHIHSSFCYHVRFCFEDLWHVHHRRQQ